MFKLCWHKKIMNPRIANLGVGEGVKYPQSVSMHSDVSMKVKKNISLSIFLNFISWSEELYAVHCAHGWMTGPRDHGWIEPLFNSPYRIDLNQIADRINYSQLHEIQRCHIRISHLLISFSYTQHLILLGSLSQIKVGIFDLDIWPSGLKLLTARMVCTPLEDTV